MKTDFPLTEKILEDVGINKRGHRLRLLFHLSDEHPLR